MGRSSRDPARPDDTTTRRLGAGPDGRPKRHPVDGCAPTRYYWCMPGTPAGAIRSAATRLGVSEVEYRRRIASGLKWCHGCRGWHERAAFGVDSSRGDGLTPICLLEKAKAQRSTYEPRPRPRPGRRYVSARNGDKHQARRRVNHLVESGLLPRPDAIPCCDCAHSGTDRRHEYDHFLGYEPEHHEHVQAVCSRCHRRRTVERGEWRTRK